MMTRCEVDYSKPLPSWAISFLANLVTCGPTGAAKGANITRQRAWQLRKARPDFKAHWDSIRPVKERGTHQRFSKRLFIEALKMPHVGGRLGVASEEIGMSKVAYATHMRSDPEFRKQVEEVRAGMTIINGTGRAYGTITEDTRGVAVLITLDAFAKLERAVGERGVTKAQWMREAIDSKLAEEGFSEEVKP